MSGEQKHKIFKLHAPHTNSKDNDLQLMKATNTAQTITFLLARAFEVSAPEITAQLDRVVQKCPIMCSRFLGVIKEPDQVISGSGIDCEKSLFKRANTGIAVPVKKIAPTDYEYDGETRCKVYEVEYEAELLPHVRIKIHYWRYFSGVPDQKARPFKIREDQIIRLRHEPYSFYRVCRIFTISLSTMVRVFFVVKPLECATEEVSAMAPAYKVFRLPSETEEMTVGLRRVDCHMMHFVSKEKDVWWYNPYLPNLS